MPPIDTAEFMHRLMTMLSAAAPAPLPPVNGLEPPMAALCARPRRFQDVYGQKGQLLEEMAATDRDPGMAGLLSDLGRALRDGTLELEAAPQSAPRLIRYVYPVV